MYRYLVVAVLAVIATQECMSAQLRQKPLNTEFPPTIELPAVDDEEDLLPSARELSKIAAVGQTEEEYVANWLEELEDMLRDTGKWDFDDGFKFNDTELVNRYSLHFGGSVSSNNKGGPSFLEIAASTEAWVATEARKFVPKSWRSMLAGHGHRVGEGTFGRVYVIDTAMSMDESNNITVAIKLEKKKGNIEDNEIALGKRFDHPYIIKVWDHGKVEDLKAMLMESASGGNLEHGHKLGRTDIAKAMLEMFVVMDYIHEEGYVHSDFKPEQVLLSAGGVAKLGDLGLTCRNGCSGFAGSPIYMSPELIRYGRRYHPADMWAMGVSLYKLTHNDIEPMFLRGHHSVDALFAKVKSLSEYHVLHKGTTLLDELLMGLLTVNTRSRLTSKQALKKAISWAEAGGIRTSEIQDIIDAKRGGKRDELPAAWNTCVRTDCYSKRLRCKEFNIEDGTKVGCLFSCHVSTSGRSASCATCEKPAFRRVENHCASCNNGYYLSGTTCKSWRCDNGPDAPCQTCVDHALRRFHNHCATCKLGSYIDEDSCKKYSVGQYVEYLSGGKWKAGVVESSSNGVVRVKGVKNSKAKVYDEIRPKPLPKFIYNGDFK